MTVLSQILLNSIKRLPSVQGEEQNIPGQSPINPVQSWEKFVSQNEDTDTGSSFERDHDNGMSTKSTGSEVGSFFVVLVVSVLSILVVHFFLYLIIF